MKTRILPTLLAFAAVAFGPVPPVFGERSLSKVLYELDDFYYASLEGSDPASHDLLKDAIMCDRIGDTVWVGVFVTTVMSDTLLARETFESMDLRTLVQIDNLFSARIRLEQLPALDALAFVETIAPASARGYTASAPSWQDFPVNSSGDPSAKKKSGR